MLYVLVKSDYFQSGLMFCEAFQLDMAYKWYIVNTTMPKTILTCKHQTEEIRLKNSKKWVGIGTCQLLLVHVAFLKKKKKIVQAAICKRTIVHVAIYY